VKKEIGRRLQQEVLAMGAVGGLTTFHVSPQLDSRWEKTELERNASAGYRYDLAIVGQVKTPTPRLMDLAEGRLLTTGAVIYTEDEVVEPVWTVYSGPDSQALRMAFVGSSLRYFWTDRPWGEEGAFKVEPWLLGNYEQWTEHLAATNGLHLFDMFGEWRRLTPRRREAPTPGLINSPARAGKRRRREALKAANEIRHRDAELLNRRLRSRLGEILEGVQDWESLGRVALREYAQQGGLTLTDRQVRRILKYVQR
jgi:hypothetical protein